MTEQRTDEEIVHDALDEFGIDPNAFEYGEGTMFECPSCPRTSGQSNSLALHHSIEHGRLIREAAAGDGDEYREFLKQVHYEKRLSPESISNELSGAISHTTIRKDCKKFGIYRPRPSSQEDTIVYMLDEMDVEEFDAKRAEAGESK